MVDTGRSRLSLGDSRLAAPSTRRQPTPDAPSQIHVVSLFESYSSSNPPNATTPSM